MADRLVELRDCLVAWAWVEGRVLVEGGARVVVRGAGEAFLAMLERVPWDWVVTQTFKLGVVSRQSADASWSSWFEAVRYCAGAELVPYFVRVEASEDAGRPEYHALVGGAPELRRLPVESWGEAGACIEELPYDRSLGAEHYVGKYLADGVSGRVRFSHRLDRGLKVVNGAWPRL